MYVGCTVPGSMLLLAKGSDVRPGVVWRRLGTGADFVAGAALFCLPRGRMCAMASSGVGWAPAQISWQAQHFAACQGVGCTPWRRLASAGHRRRFRGRRSTLLLAKGSGVRPGVVWRRLGTGVHFVADAALCCLPRGRMYALASSGVGWARAQISWQAQHTLLLLRGRMYALASSGVGWAPAQISWQAQHFAACQGDGCTPSRRLASSGVGWAPAQISWQAQHFAACPGVGCTPWRRLASSGVGWAPAQISWQAQHFAACQGVGCTPWRRLASAGHRRRFRGRRSTLLLAKGSDVRPGVVWRRLGTGADFVAGAALCCLPRGRMYALASSGVGWAPAQISWQAQHFAACQGVGCIRPGVVWRRLGTGADFVAGAALCCWPRGRMYALASAGVGWAPAQISWQAQHFTACQGVGRTPWRRLASSGVGWAPAQISWQAQHFGNQVAPLETLESVYNFASI